MAEEILSREPSVFPASQNNTDEKNRELSLLLESMINAFVLFQSVFDDNGNFVSYRFLYINKAYEETTGVLNDQVAGKTVHEVWPGTEDEWVRLYGHTAVTGEAQSFEQYHEPTGKLYRCRTYRPWDTSERFCVVFEDITEQYRQKEQLLKMQWLLDPDTVRKNHLEETATPYGDVTVLNSDGLIRKAISREILSELAREIMLLLGTSLAIYEKNGDYAFGIFSSGWCRLLDSSSRDLCGTDDNAEALASGRWLCHECCWNRSAIPAMETGESVDIQCSGGIRLYSVPIKAGNDTVGVMNIGYGDPPTDKEALTRLALAYSVDVNALEKQALLYKPRPSFIIEVAKLRLRNTAALIGEAVERYRTGKTLGATLESYHSLFEAMKDGVAVYSSVDSGEDFEFVDINPAGELLSHVKKPEITGRRVTDVFPAVADIGLLDAFKAVYKDGKTRKLPITLYNDGRLEEWVENTVYKLDSGHIVAVYMDTSEEHKAKQALEIKSTELEEVIRAIPDALILMDGDGRILRCNPAFSEIFGYLNEDVTGESISALLRSSKKAFNFEENSFRPGSPHGSLLFEELFRRSDGSEFPGEVLATSLRDPKGEIAGYLSLVRDITARKEIDDEIRELNSNLESRVSQRTEELQIANTELENFAYSVSHDLRAPLRAIDGFSRIVVNDYAEVLDDEGRRLLNVVRTNTRKMNDLITDILDLSRVGRQNLKLSLLDMRGMVRSIFSEISSPEEQEHFELRIGDLPDVMADPALIKRVWSNLLSNALKYSVPSEVKLIEVQGKKLGGECLYSVTDSGVGFNPAYSDKLFGLFQRLHGNSEFPGSGVGLAIAQKIISRHGGKIWGESNEGHGAVFHFTLPDRGGLNEQ